MTKLGNYSKAWQLFQSLAIIPKLGNYFKAWQLF
jgi:hypothetical protein